MKKHVVSFVIALSIAFSLMSFVISVKKYGGTASASGKVTYVTDYEKTQGRKVGDVETLEVSINCRYDDNAAAKAALKSEIENKASTKKIKLTSTISYDVTSCEK